MMSHSLQTLYDFEDKHMSISDKLDVTSNRATASIRWNKISLRHKYSDESVRIIGRITELRSIEAFLKSLAGILLMICLIMLPWDVQAVERDYLGVPVTSNALAYAAGGLIVADWLQSIQIEGSKDLQEDNGYIGAEARRGDVNRYFVMKLMGHLVVNTFRPLRKMKNIWNIYQIGITFSAIHGNYKLGLRVKL